MRVSLALAKPQAPAKPQALAKRAVLGQQTGMSRSFIISLILLTLVGGFAAWLLTREPPNQLDIIDSVWRGEAGVRVAEGVEYAPGRRLDIYAPAGSRSGETAGSPLPVAIFYYGGGWRGGARAHYGFAGRAFASRGFLTIVADYRLVPAGRFPVMLQDSAAAFAWVHRNAARYGGDGDHIGVTGHSAGAYNALMLALDPQWLRGAGVPPETLAGAASLAGPADFYPWTADTARGAMGHVADPQITQPINFASADAPPIWLGHGTDDTVVRIRNSRNLTAALTDVGAPVTLREYAGFSHNDMIMAVSRPFRSKGPVLDDAAAFLRRAIDAARREGPPPP